MGTPQEVRIAQINERLDRLMKIIDMCADQDSEVVKDLKELQSSFLTERQELVLLSTINDKEG